MKEWHKEVNILDNTGENWEEVGQFHLLTLEKTGTPLLVDGPADQLLQGPERGGRAGAEDVGRGRQVLLTSTSTLLTSTSSSFTSTSSSSSSTSSSSSSTSSSLSSTPLMIHCHLEVNMLAIAMKFCSAGSHSVERERYKKRNSITKLGPLYHIIRFNRGSVCYHALLPIWILWLGFLKSPFSGFALFIWFASFTRLTSFTHMSEHTHLPRCPCYTQRGMSHTRSHYN